MTITVDGILRDRETQTAAAGSQTWTSTLVEDDTNDIIYRVTTVTTTPTPIVVNTVAITNTDETLTAAAGSFSNLRVGDVVSGDAAIPVGAVIASITPSPDGIVDDSLEMDLPATGTTSANLTFTGPVVTDPLFIIKQTNTVSNKTVTAAVNLYLFDGLTNGPALATPANIEAAILLATETLPIPNPGTTNYDDFLTNQRLASPA